MDEQPKSSKRKLPRGSIAKAIDKLRTRISDAAKHFCTPDWASKLKMKDKAATRTTEAVDDMVVALQKQQREDLADEVKSWANVSEAIRKLTDVSKQKKFPTASEMVVWPLAETIETFIGECLRDDMDRGNSPTTLEVNLYKKMAICLRLWSVPAMHRYWATGHYTQRQNTLTKTNAYLDI